MALNPPLTPTGQPYRLENEYMLAERPGMEIEVQTPGMSKLSAKGKVFLSTARLVFVNSDLQGSHFKAIDMPVAHLSKVDFKQPVFGANYLVFTCRPFLNLLPADSRISLYFMEGGAEKFLKMFAQVSQQVQEQVRAGRMNNNMQQQWSNGFFTQKAFYDPSDPTVVLAQQPQVFSPAGQFVGNNIYQGGQPPTGQFADNNIYQGGQPPAGQFGGNNIHQGGQPPAEMDYPAAPPNDYRLQPGTQQGGFYPVMEGGAQPRPANALPQMYNPHVTAQQPDAGLYYGFFGPTLVQY